MNEVGLNPLSESMASVVGEEKSVDLLDTAGAKLSAARQQLGLSLEQAAEQLKLSHRQLLAIESNDFDKLPKMVIVRGFVRSYAKLLRVDPAPIIACLPGEASLADLDTDLRPTLATPFLESKSHFLGRSESHNKKYMFGAGILAMAALLFVLGQHFEQSEAFKSIFTHSDVVKPSVEQVAASLPLTDSATPAESQSDVFPPDVVVQASTVLERVAASESTSTLAASPVVLPSVSEVKPAPANVGGAVVPLTNSASKHEVASGTDVQAGNNKLRLTFRQDSWVQVKKESGEVVTSHLAKAGTEEFFDVKEPVQVRLGNAHGVDATLRGAALEIVPPKDTNVVNLSVK
ncbi:helix-turn-helix domain-containing protein [Undibacterium sp. SXout11W]|uniref:helix-turn-helix domain-containing protein n=1 Tax=Undibacterium sp. SXout11W TaxID=3413050 RepID=UPI003BF0A0CE